MNKIQYLKNLRTQQNYREIYDTWTAFGGLKVDSNTKMYIKDTIFQVNTNGQMKDSLVYCNYAYTVNPSEGFDPIDWDTATYDSTEGMISFYQGVVSPHFSVLLTADEIASIDTTIPIDPNFMPFTGKDADKAASISFLDPNDYIRCVSDLGIPFLMPEELEYNMDTIIEICVKPAVDQYYTFFPITIDEACGAVGAGGERYVEYHQFPENPTAQAYKGRPFLTLGGTMGGSGGGFGSGAMSFFRSEYMYGGGGFGGTGRFGSGISYRGKVVPGFTGGFDSFNAHILNRAAQQGIINYFRQEYFRDVYKDNKRYVYCHATTGGALNMKWYCMDTVFEHIPYWHVVDVTKLVSAYALRKVGMLRSLIKPQDNSPIDFSKYLSDAESIETKIVDKWSKDTSVLAAGVMRGGTGSGI